MQDERSGDGAADTPWIQRLAKRWGIVDGGLLAQLQELALDEQSVAVLVFVPLAEVAWADGVVDARERAAILDAAHAAGLKPQVPGYERLQLWLEQRPLPMVFEVARAFLQHVHAGLDMELSTAARGELLRRARDVAIASGVGDGPPVSAAEADALRRIGATD